MNRRKTDLVVGNDAPPWFVCIAFAVAFAVLAWVFVPWQVVIAVYAISTAIMFPLMARAGRE